jgi:hypothetical protein
VAQETIKIAILSGAFRAVLFVIAGWLGRHYTIFSEAEFWFDGVVSGGAQFLAAVLIGSTALVWQWRDRVRTWVRLHVALLLPDTATIEDVKAVEKALPAPVKLEMATTGTLCPKAQEVIAQKTEEVVAKVEGGETVQVIKLTTGLDEADIMFAAFAKNKLLAKQIMKQLSSEHRARFRRMLDRCYVWLTEVQQEMGDPPETYQRASGMDPSRDEYIGTD